MGVESEGEAKRENEGGCVCTCVLAETGHERAVLCGAERERCKMNGIHERDLESTA